MTLVSQNAGSENSPASLASPIPSVVRRYSRANGLFWGSRAGSWYWAVIWAMVWSVSWSAHAGDPGDNAARPARATTVLILRSIGIRCHHLK
jgi:hypothetical protein